MSGDMGPTLEGRSGLTPPGSGVVGRRGARPQLRGPGSGGPRAPGASGALTGRPRRVIVVGASGGGGGGRDPESGGGGCECP